MLKTQKSKLKKLLHLSDGIKVRLRLFVLTRVKGIGRWTVQMLLIFRLKRWDVLPVDDLGVRAGIRKLYGLEALPDRKTTERFGQKWKPYCSIASWYLWRSLELKPV